MTNMIRLENVLWKGDKISCFIMADNVASFYARENKTYVHTKNDERYVIEGTEALKQLCKTFRDLGYATSVIGA